MPSEMSQTQGVLQHAIADTKRSSRVARWVWRAGARPTLADAAGRGWREPGHGPAVKIEHQQDADALTIPAGLHALRTDPEHAGTATRAIDGKVCRDRVRHRAVSNRYRGVEMRGWLRHRVCLSTRSVGFPINTRIKARE